MLPIPSCPGYFATEDGEIIGPRGELTLFQRGNYLKCQAAGKQRRVNRLVCEAFHGLSPSPKHHAAHKDGDSLNNRPTNLYWATPRENTDDIIKHESLKGENHPRAKLTVLDVESIRYRKATGESLKSIQSTFPGVSYATISHASTGRNWK